MRSKILISILTILVLIVAISNIDDTVYAAKPNTQTIKTQVESNSVDAKPFVWYYQQDAGHFKILNAVSGTKEASNKGTDNDPFPAQSDVRQHLDINNYPAREYKDMKTGKTYTNLQVTNKRMKPGGVKSGPGLKTISMLDDGKTLDTVSTTAGSPGLCTKYSTRYGTIFPKVNCQYPFTFSIIYLGDVEEAMKIKATPSATLKVKDKKQITASVSHKPMGSSTFGAPVDVTTASETKWRSSNPGVATVDSKGMVTAVSKGTTNVCANWTKDKWDIEDCVIIRVVDDGPTGVDPDPPTGGGSGQVTKFHTIPQGFAELKQGTVSPGSSTETWEAMAGVPTTENLFFSVGGSEYMMEIETEYVPSQTTTRNYNVHFNAVRTSAWIDPMSHPNTCSSPCSPDPRSATDIAGEEFWETVTTTSECTKGYYTPIKTDKDGKVTGGDWVCTETKYGWIASGITDMVGGYEYPWTQTVTYDYTKINSAKVWQLNRGSVEGMTPLTNMDIISADATGNNSQIWFQISGTNSETGRLRYSLQAKDLSIEGLSCTPSSNHDDVDCSKNSDSRHINRPNDDFVNEDKIVENFKKLMGDVVVISDILVFQTAAGDQVALYYDQHSGVVKTSENYPDVKASASAHLARGFGSWDQRNTVYVTGYNGAYALDGASASNRRLKYAPFSLASNSVVNNRSKFMTIFDNPTYAPAGRPGETYMSNVPSQGMSLFVNDIDIIDTHPNGDYVPGNAYVDYDVVLDYNGGTGAITETRYPAKYSPNHSKINNVLIHDPVSSEYSYVVSESPILDQRTKTSKILSTERQKKALAEVPNLSLSNDKTGNKFLVLDRSFSIYFPNLGDFPQQTGFGLSDTVTERGPSFTNNMDTTIWTKAKYVTFTYPVIYQGSMYLAGEKIWLDVPSNYFEFYIPLGAGEHLSARVNFVSIAINGEDEGGEPTNKQRYPKRAKHSAVTVDIADVVGRIGNMVIEDTGDFRFSNLFKQPITNEWIIKGLVNKVDTTKQRYIVGDTKDLRGEAVADRTKFLNTYGITKHMEQNPIPLPLTPDKNNIAQLRKQPIRLGYDIYSDLQTIGNYQKGMLQVKYYYYAVNVPELYKNIKSGNTNYPAIKKLDLYESTGSKYRNIYQYGEVDKPGWKSSDKESSPIKINWNTENLRRNYNTTEKANTESVSKYLAYSSDLDGNGSIEKNNSNGVDETAIELTIPRGWAYTYGDSRLLQLFGRNKTFVGSTTTYGEDKNPGNRIDPREYYLHGQRWHMNTVLPSSTVPVESGKKLTLDSIKEVRNSDTVILIAAEIKAQGELYSLKYDGDNVASLRFMDINGDGVIDEKDELTITPDMLNKDPGDFDDDLSIITITSSNKSVINDMSTKSTH